MFIGSFRHKLSSMDFVLVLKIRKIRTMNSIGTMFLFHDCGVGVRLSYLQRTFYGHTV
jgi:hypothetical protein